MLRFLSADWQPVVSLISLSCLSRLSSPNKSGHHNRAEKHLKVMINTNNLRQFDSSEPSRHWTRPLHRASGSTHWPSSHLCSPSGQGGAIEPESWNVEETNQWQAKRVVQDYVCQWIWKKNYLRNNSWKP